MHLNWKLALLLLFFSQPTSASSQSLTDISNTRTVFADDFLDEPTGALAVHIKNACKLKRDLTGTRPTVVSSGTIYWGKFPDCVRMIINHKGTGESDLPTYLGVQIIGLYGSNAPETKIVLRRKGSFLRDKKPLDPDWGASLLGEQLSQEKFDELHGANDASAGAALSEFDRVAKWHGTPEGGRDDSWSERFRFQRSKTFDTQISLTNRVLENRLIRFTPYSPKDGPDDGPVTFEFNTKGALAAVVKTFAPGKVDYENQVLLVFSQDREQIARIVNTQIANFGSNWLSRFFAPIR